jgi:hypothetical protein
MGDVVFAKTRTYYQPYDDLFRLVELSGYDTCFVDEIDPSDSTKTYIYSPDNGETLAGWPRARARIIHLQMEWVLDLNPYPLLPGVSERWTGDRFHATSIGARFVPIGSHVDLNLHPADKDAKEYDVVFMAYTDIYRRKCILDALKAQGFSIAPNGWGDERDEILRKSRVMIHVHQHENIPTIAPLRWCIASAYSLPIISETVSNRAPFLPQHFITWDYDQLIEKVTQHLQMHEYGWLNEYGTNLHNFLCHEMTFRNSIERAL